jgi:hypothetical protein
MMRAKENRAKENFHHADTKAPRIFKNKTSCLGVLVVKKNKKTLAQDRQIPYRPLVKSSNCVIKTR